MMEKNVSRGIRIILIALNHEIYFFSAEYRINYLIFRLPYVSKGDFFSTEWFYCVLVSLDFSHSYDKSI